MTSFSNDSVIGLLPVLDSLLADQQQLTAVERFSQRHTSATRPVMAELYSELIPLNRPKAGEQYAFEVDLDACSGCKACVVACHNLNGLEESEMWRNVGVLYGGTDREPRVVEPEGHTPSAREREFYTPARATPRSVSSLAR